MGVAAAKILPEGSAATRVQSLITATDRIQTRKKNMRIVILAALVAVLSACAQQPNSITPVSVGDAYSGISCKQASKLYNAELVKVPSLVAKQKNAVTGDAVGVFLIGVPVSSLSGDDLEGEIAVTKGKLLALGARLEVCGVTPPPVVWG